MVHFCTVYVDFAAYICVSSVLFVQSFKYAEQAQSFSPPEMKKAAGTKPAAPHVYKATVFSFGYAKGAAGIKPAAP
jgi:hypothetical protein